MRKVIASALFALCLFASAGATTQPWLAQIPQAQQVGEGVFKRLGWSIYTARLWAPEGIYAPGKPFALSLTYEFDIAQSRIVQASIEEMTRLGAPVADRPQWREALEAVIRDVGKSQSLAGVYIPGQGAVFYHDDLQTGRLDEELAQYFFGIWLDPRTSDPALRTALLGGAP